MITDQKKSTLQSFIQTLKSARQAKGLSQRDLATQISIPQSHLSKIESGSVDLQLSTFIDLVRILDLELLLVPRQLLPQIKVLLSVKNKKSSTVAQKPAYSLDPEEEDE